MASDVDRERLIRRLADSLELTAEETTALLAHRSEYNHWSGVYEEMAREMEAVHERMRPYLEAIAAEEIRNGFGDLTAPLAPGEYVHAANTCPHDGCTWILPIEWRCESQVTPTRFRGYIERDALCRAHMEQHQIDGESPNGE